MLCGRVYILATFSFVGYFRSFIHTIGLVGTYNRTCWYLYLIKSNEMYTLFLSQLRLAYKIFISCHYVHVVLMDED